MIQPIASPTACPQPDSLPYLRDRGVTAYIDRSCGNAHMPPLVARLPDGRFALIWVGGGTVHVAVQGATPHCPKPFCVFRNVKPVGEVP